MALNKDEILDAIGSLTVLELKELLDAFEEKFEVTAAAPVAAVAVSAGGAAAGSLRPTRRSDAKAPSPRPAANRKPCATARRTNCR